MFWIRSFWSSSCPHLNEYLWFLCLCKTRKMNLNAGLVNCKRPVGHTFSFVMLSFVMGSIFILTLFWRYSDAILTLFLRYSDAILTLFWRYSDVILTLFWRYSDVILTLLILTLFLHYSDVISMLFWRHSGVISTLLRRYSGFAYSDAILTLFWRYFDVILTLFLRYSDVISTLFWRYSDVILHYFTLSVTLFYLILMPLFRGLSSELIIPPSVRASVRPCVPLLGEAQNICFCTILSEISENHLCILQYLAPVALKTHHKIDTFFVKCSKHTIKWEVEIVNFNTSQLKS